MANEKKCSACGIVKQFSDFYRRGDRDAPRSRCKDCERIKRASESCIHAERAANWRAADPDRAHASSRASWKKNKTKRDSYNRRRMRDKKYREENCRRCKDNYRKNVTERLSYVKSYRESNLEKWRDYLRRYAKDNPDKYRSYRAKRRAMKSNAKGFWTDADVLEMRKLQGNRCAVCLQYLHDYRAVDHIKALSCGGTNWPRNLQLLCLSCNSKKRKKDFTEFLIEIGLVNV